MPSTIAFRRRAQFGVVRPAQRVTRAHQEAAGVEPARSACQKRSGVRRPERARLSGPLAKLLQHLIHGERARAGSRCCCRRRFSRGRLPGARRRAECGPPARAASTSAVGDVAGVVGPLRFTLRTRRARESGNAEVALEGIRNRAAFGDIIARRKPVFAARKHAELGERKAVTRVPSAGGLELGDGEAHVAAGRGLIPKERADLVAGIRVIRAPVASDCRGRGELRIVRRITRNCTGKPWLRRYIQLTLG